METEAGISSFIASLAYFMMDFCYQLFSMIGPYLKVCKHFAKIMPMNLVIEELYGSLGASHMHGMSIAFNVL